MIGNVARRGLRLARKPRRQTGKKLICLDLINLGLQLAGAQMDRLRESAGQLLERSGIAA
jgi:hypothetical protein